MFEERRIFRDIWSREICSIEKLEVKGNCESLDKSECYFAKDISIRKNMDSVLDEKRFCLKINAEEIGEFIYFFFLF